MKYHAIGQLVVNLFYLYEGQMIQLERPSSRQEFQRAFFENKNKSTNNLRTWILLRIMESTRMDAVSN